MLDQLYQLLIIQPAYNISMWVYGSLGMEHAGLTSVIIGIFVGALFIPLMITGYFDQLRTRQLQKQIEEIQALEKDEQKQQQKIFTLLKKKNIRYQSESIFLVGMAAFVGYFYSAFSSYWNELHSNLLYAFVQAPSAFSPLLGSTNLAYSSAEISLIPTVLLFFELKQSYKEQHFLTNFIDRWYAVLLPLFVYFLIFWLPAALSLMLAGSLLVSLYLRFLLQSFTKLRAAKAA